MVQRLEGIGAVVEGKSTDIFTLKEQIGAHEQSVLQLRQNLQRREQELQLANERGEQLLGKVRELQAAYEKLQRDSTEAHLAAKQKLE